MSRLSFGAQVVVFAILGGALYGIFYIWLYSPKQQEKEEKTVQQRNRQKVDHGQVCAQHREKNQQCRRTLFGRRAGNDGNRSGPAKHHGRHLA